MKNTDEYAKLNFQTTNAGSLKTLNDYVAEKMLLC